MEPVQSKSPRRESVQHTRVEAETSYKSMLKGDNQSGGGRASTQERPALELFPEEEHLNELQSCSVGCLTIHIEAEALQTCFFMEGWRGVKVSAIGERLVFVTREPKGSY